MSTGDAPADASGGVEAPEPGGLADRFRLELAELVATSKALSSQHDIRTLLGIILAKSRLVTGADAGSVYVLEGERDDKRLHFMLSQNDSIAIDFEELTLPVDERSIVGHAALHGRPINIADLAMLDEPGHNPWGFRHNRTFDERTGYRARSMLTVPLLSARDEVIGVVQLINRKRRRERRLVGPADFETEVVPFDAHAEEIALALASQAGVSLENAILYDEIQKLFEGFVDASVMAIESRDPTTSGHSRRVATLTVALAQRVDAATDGPYRGVRFTQDELKQIEFAGVLHDFGKVGVREHVLVKAKKLYEWERRLIEQRFGYMRKALEVEQLEAVQGPVATGGHRTDTPVDGILRARLADVESTLACVLAANEPTVLDEGSFERLKEAGRRHYLDVNGVQRPWLEPDEIAALEVRRGSLTGSERLEIQSHVAHTTRFLRRIPWGRSLRRIPEIAGAHHEYLDGSGYPDGLRADQIPIEARMMTIADIYDALTASDRPYKKAVSRDRALAIIEQEVKLGRCDGALWEIFVATQVWKAL